MYPYIHTSLGEISVFAVCVAIGVVVLFFSMHLILKGRNKQTINEDEIYIYPKIVISGFVGFIVAILTDLIFKYIEYGILKIYGITFYGGMIGAAVMMYFLLLFTEKNTQYNKKDWFDLLTVPFILFHIFGRLGCFFGGCCYGKYSQSIFAIAFPDNEKMGIIHNGLKCYPTQLFEVIWLLLILRLVIYSNNKFKTYLFSYSSIRFLLEFLRGDDRGTVTQYISPSQLISIIIFCFAVAWEIRNITKKKIQPRQD